MAVGAGEKGSAPSLPQANAEANEDPVTAICADAIPDASATRPATGLLDPARVLRVTVTYVVEFIDQGLNNEPGAPLPRPSREIPGTARER